ncbi:MAG: DUF5996 family protein [Acidimicrobiia bacterium]
MSEILPALPEDWETTRATLHAYAQAIGVVPRAHAAAHPKWWHVSLTVQPDGLVTEDMALPDGGTFNVRLDLKSHAVVVEAGDGRSTALSMTEGATGTQMGDRVIAAVAELGLEGDYNREKFEDEDPREYDPAAGEAFLQAVNTVNEVFEQHRASLSGDVGPVQLWPHGFDLATEWLGTRVEKYEEEGQVTEYPSQLNLGFFPGSERPYFYSNPWPFEGDKLTSEPLPHGAQWHTEGWEGSILYYDQLQGDPDAATKLAEYARAVFDLAAPTLTAE